MTESLQPFITEGWDGPAFAEGPHPRHHEVFYEVARAQVLCTPGEGFECRSLGGLQQYVWGTIPLHLFALGHKVLLLVCLVIGPARHDK